MLLCILAANEWSMHSMDIKCAFLQGSPIHREVYLQPPPFAQTDKLWKLRKTPYGLSDAGRQWYIRVQKEMLVLGAKQSSFDRAVFMWHNQQGSLSGLMVVHVDDFLYGGTVEFRTKVITKLRETFVVGSEESEGFKYLGLRVEEDQGGIALSIKGYADSCSDMNTAELGADRSRVLSPAEVTKLKQMSGQINWAATQARPDMAFENCMVGNSIKNATVSDVYKANKVLRRLRDQPVFLFFPKLTVKACRLVGFCDASFGNLPDRGSQGGYLIFLVDDLGRYCPLAWQSRRIRRVVNSTLAAECLAAVEVAEACVYLATILKELLSWKPAHHKGDAEFPISIMCDNKSLVDAVHSTTSVENKRLRIDISVLRDMVSQSHIAEFRWISTHLQVANALTKSGCSSLYLLNVLQYDLRYEAKTGAFVEA